MCRAKIAKNKYNGRVRSLAAVLVLCLIWGGVVPAHALPSDPVTTQGEIQIDRPSDKEMLIRASSEDAIVEFGSFSIAADETVRILQNNDSSRFLARVTGSERSELLGALEANGIFFLVNPAGIHVGDGASVSARGLVLSTHDIANEAFLSGNYTFRAAAERQQLQAIINDGRLVIGEGGWGALFARQVTNGGEILARKGSVVIGSGERMTLSVPGSAVNLVIDEGLARKIDADQPTIQNTGLIRSESGAVLIDAKMAEATWDQLVNNEGVIEAYGATERNGRIELVSNGVIVNSGGLISDLIRERGMSFRSYGSLGSGVLGQGQVWMDNLDGAADVSGNVGVDVMDSGDINLVGNIMLTGNVAFLADSDSDRSGYINWNNGVSIDGGGYNLTLYSSSTPVNLRAMTNVANLTLFSYSDMPSSYTMNNSFAVSGNFTMGAAIPLDIGANTLTIGGDMSFQENSYSGSGTIAFNKNGNQTLNLGNLSTPSFSNITKSGSGTLSITGSSSSISLGNVTIGSGTSVDISGLAGAGTGTVSISTLSNDGNLILDGSESLGIATMDTDSGTVTYDGFTGYTGLAAGDSYYNLTFSGSGSWSLDNAVDVNGDLTLSSGVFDMYTHTMNLAGNWNHGGGTYTHGGGYVYFDGGNQTIYGDNEFYGLTKSDAANDGQSRTLSFEAGKTTSIAALFMIDGIDDDDRILLRSTSAGSQWKLDIKDNAVSVSIDFADVKDSDGSLGETLGGTNIRNSGNNINWGFASYTWTGLVGSSWGTAGNWDRNAVPYDGDTVVIADTANDPVLDQHRTVGSLTVHSGAVLDLANYNFTVSGALSNNGTIELDGGQSVSIGTMDTDSGLVKYVVTGGSFTGLAFGNAYYNLEFNSSADWVLTSALDVNGDLTIGSTVLLDDGGYNINLAGNWVNSGGYTGAGTVTFDGAGTQTLRSGGIGNTNDFQNVAKTNSGTLQFVYSPVDIDGTLTIASGTVVDLNGIDLSLGTLSNGGTVKLQGAESISISAGNDVDSGSWRYVGIDDGVGVTYTIKDFGLSGDYYNLILDQVDFTEGDSYRIASGLSVSGNLSIANYASYNANNQVTVVSGNVSIDVYSGYTAGSANQSIGGNLTLDSNSTYAGGAGLTDIDGNVSLADQANFTFPLTALKVGGDWTVDDGANLSGTAVIEFDKAAGTQSITSGGHSFTALTHSGAGTLRMMDQLDVSSLSNTAGVLYLNGYNLIVSGSESNSATIRLQGNETASIGSHDVDSGTWEYVGDGTGGAADTYAIKDFGATDYYHLKINSTDSNDIFDDSASNMGGGNFDIAGNFEISSGVFNGVVGVSVQTVGTVTVNGGTYTAAGAFHEAGELVLSSGTMSLGSADGFTVNGDFNQSGGTFTTPIGTSNGLTIEGDFTRTGGTFNHNNGRFVMTGTDQSITGSTTFYEFEKITAGLPRTLTFETGSTTTIAGSIRLEGAIGNLLSLRSSTNGSQWTIVLPGTAQQTFSYIDVKDSNNTGTRPSTITGAMNTGNNTGWFGKTFVWTGATSTNYGTSTNWDLNDGTVPTADDDVTIADAVNDPVLDQNRSVTSLTISANAILDLVGYNFSISGALSNSGTIKLQGGQTVSVGTMDTDSGSIVYTGPGAYGSGLAFGDAYYHLTFFGAGSWTLDANLDVNGSFGISSGTFIDGGYAVSIAGDWSNNGAYTGTGTVIFDGSGTQTLTSGGTGTTKDFQNITKSNSGTLQFVTNAVEIDGTLTIASGTTVDLNGRNLTLGTLSNSGTFLLEGGETVAITTMDTDSGTVKYDGTGSYTGLAAGDSYYNLEFDAPTSFYTLDAALDVNNDITIANCTFTDAGYDIRVGGDWVNSTSDYTGTGTVIFDGSGTQTLTSGGTGTTKDFQNITKSNSGTLQFVTNAVEIDGTLTIASGTTVDLNGRNLTLGTLSNSGTFLLEGGETVAITTMDTDSGTVKYDGTGSYTGLAAGDSYYNLTFGGPGSWTLDAALDVNNNLTITAGTLVDAGFGIALAGNWSNAATYTGTGTVTLDGDNQALSGSTDFENLTKLDSLLDGSDEALTFTAGDTFRVNGTLTLTGLGAGDRVNLVSSNPGTRWNLRVTGAASIDFVDATDSDASSGSLITAANSIDGGNNLNWNFSGSGGGSSSDDSSDPVQDAGQYVSEVMAQETDNNRQSLPDPDIIRLTPSEATGGSAADRPLDVSQGPVVDSGRLTGRYAGEKPHDAGSFRSEEKDGRQASVTTVTVTEGVVDVNDIKIYPAESLSFDPKTGAPRLKAHYFYAGDSGKISARRVSTGQEVWSEATDRLEPIVLIHSASGTRTARLNPKTGWIEELSDYGDPWRLKVDAGAREAVWDESGGKLYAFEPHNDRIDEWDIAGQKKTRSFVTDADPSSASLNPENHTLFVSHGLARKITTIDLRTAQKSGEITLGFSPSQIVYLAGIGKVAVLDTAGNSVHFVDPKGQAGSLTVAVGSGPQKMTWDPVKEMLYVSNYLDNTVSVVRVQDGIFQEKDRWSVGQRPLGLAITGESDLLVANAASGDIWRLSDHGNKKAEYKGFDAPLSVAVSAPFSVSDASKKKAGDENTRSA